MKVDMEPMLSQEIPKEQLAFGAAFLRAFMECDGEVQKYVVQLARLAGSPEATDREKTMALYSIAEALRPVMRNGHLGISVDEADQIAVEDRPDGAAALARLQNQRKVFSERLAALIERKNVSQTELAKAIGVSQPAISLLLARKCRPQRRTVEKVAEALNVEIRELWPED